MMFKYISLLPAISILSSFNSYAMLSKEINPFERAGPKTLRPGFISRNSDAKTSVLGIHSLQNLYGQIQRRQKEEGLNSYLRIAAELPEARNQPKVSTFSDIFTSCDAVIESLSKITVTEQQITEIRETFAGRGLNLRDTLLLKANFVNSLKSSLKYMQNASECLENERNFYEGKSLNFSSSQVLAGNVLPFNHALRKELIIRLLPVPSQKIGFISACIEKINEENPQDPIGLMRLYTQLFGLSAVNLSIGMSNAAEPKISTQVTAAYIKYKRLILALSDGDTELFLKYSELLHPYAERIQNILKIERFDDVFTYKNRIQTELDQQIAKIEYSPILSRSGISALTEKYNEKYAVAEKNLEPSESRRKGAGLSTAPTATFYSDTYDSSVDIQRNSTRESKRLAREVEAREARKLQAKEKKKDKVATKSKVLSNDKRPNSLEQHANQIGYARPVIKIGGGPFKIYKKIMNKEFKGTMEKVVLLIESLGGLVEEGRSGCRIKIELPHIGNNKKAYLDMLPPEYDDENENKTPHVQPQTTTTTSPLIEERVPHVPHKAQSKKLRPGHLRDIYELLIEAGYPEGTVQRQ